MNTDVSLAVQPPTDHPHCIMSGRDYRTSLHMQPWSLKLSKMLLVMGPCTPPSGASAKEPRTPQNSQQPLQH